MNCSTRPGASHLLAWLVVGAIACGSQSASTGQAIDPLTEGGAGTAAAGDSSTTGGGTAGDSSTTGGGTAGDSSTSGGGTAGASTGSGGAAGTSTGSGGSSSGGGGATGTPRDGGPVSCDSDFKNALAKDCASDAECTLADHNDCCGDVVTSIRKGTDAAFSAAEKAFQSCVPGCGLRGCFHATMAEDGKNTSMVGQAFFARCIDKRCTSVVAVAPTCVASRDCPVGQICVTYSSGLPNAPAREECRSNPCGIAEATSCACAGSVCKGFGIGSCTVSGTDLICRDGLR